MVRRVNVTVRCVIVLACSRKIIDLQIHSVGFDLGKMTFHLVALRAAGKVLLRRNFMALWCASFGAGGTSTVSFACLWCQG